MDARAIVEAVSRLAVKPGRGGGRVLTLDEVLDYPSLEDEASFRSILLEHYSRPLIQRLPVPPRRRDTVFVGVDSSSRLVETPSHSIVVTTVSASSSIVVELYDHPRVYRYPVEPRGMEPPYIAITPGGEYPYPLTGSNPQGRTYDPDYSVEDVMDEWRVFMENWIMSEVLPGAPKVLGGVILLLDGPLTPAPGRRGGDDSLWEDLLLGRARAVGMLEDLGVPVVGVVKRSERSRILPSTPGLSEAIKECTGHPAGGDRALIHLLLESGCVERSPGRILATPRIRVEPRIPGALSKIVEYIVIPPGRWQMKASQSRVYRLEYTPRTLELLEELGLEPHQVLGLDTVARGSLEPVTIKASDRRARMISKALRGLIVHGLRRGGIPLSYGSEVGVRG